MKENASNIPRFIVCPYCGSMHKDHLPDVCQHCNGPLDPESREQTKRDLGPWFVQNVSRPFAPGMRFEKLLRCVSEGKIRPLDVVRGPTTSQFWTVARKVPGLSHHFGLCHACQAPASPEDKACLACGASFRVSLDRDLMGLGGDGAQASAFEDPVNVRSMPHEPGSPTKDSSPDSLVPTEELNSRTSTQLRRELLAARRRQNALHWLLGILVLGVLTLLVLQELKSPVSVVPEPSEPPAPSPSNLTPEAPSASASNLAVDPIEVFESSPLEPLPAFDLASSIQDDQLTLDDALRLYHGAVDANRSPETRQAELGALKVEIAPLVASASADQRIEWETLASLVRQAIMDLQAELRLSPEASKATFPNNP